MNPASLFPASLPGHSRSSAPFARRRRRSHILSRRSYGVILTTRKRRPGTPAAMSCLRIYLERPFLISGDLESLGIVIATPTRPADDNTQPLISRWGADPTRPITPHPVFGPHGDKLMSARRPPANLLAV